MTVSLATAAQSIDALAEAMPGLVDIGPLRAMADQAVARGHFTPVDDELLRSWFARYLTVRAGLHEVLEELTPLALRPARHDIGPDDEMRVFALAYTAASVLVRAARVMIEGVADRTIIKRKLDEADAARRIPRKQFTVIRRRVTSPRTAWMLYDAIRFADVRRGELDALAQDETVGCAVRHLEWSEEALRMRFRDLARARLRYRLHSWRRRQMSALRNALFGILEVSGCIVADVRLPHEDRVSAAVRRDIEALLEPGDVIVSRHDQAMSNLFLPGYWPHTSLHLGPGTVRAALRVEVDDDRAARWVEPRRVLEARKDGVLLRALDDTLAVDAVAVLRPRLAPVDIARALGNALVHEGKPYNFDFDFFTADRIVCTEVVYRAYDGVGGIVFALTERGGRPSLSAEDIVDMARTGQGFEAVAVFGTPRLGNRLVTGAEAREAL